MSSKQGGKAKPLKQPKADKKEYDEDMNKVCEALFLANNITAEENSMQLRAAKHRVEQLMMFRKLSPPAFNGSSDPAEANDWVISLEKIFNILECSDEERVSFAIFMLKGASYNWWRRIRPNADEDKQLTWKDFKKLFYQRYLPRNTQYMYAKKDEFRELAQGSMSVAEYSDKFNELAQFVEWKAFDDEITAEKFRHGLRADIGLKIAPLSFNTYRDVLESALVVENLGENVARKRQRVEGNRACFNCGRNDHLVRDCPLHNG